jgi:hypothetical protein
MKRLPMTPKLIAEIKAAVGEDVDPSGFAVFEAVALNSHPLPGKDGTLFEKASISLLTLRQMADSINGGNHLPLIKNHDMDTTPFGRVFKADTMFADDGSVELRTLFYIDNTEPELAAKIDAGSVDETSVQFLASQILCSECDFDYRGEESSWVNVVDRTCGNGHEIGTNGIHARLVGLQTFTELSLVTRGAAKNPKIVGKSASKLAAPLQALAARGFEVDALFLTASKGELKVDLQVLLSQLDEKTTAAATATAKLETVTGERDAAIEARDAAIAERDTAQTRITELETANTNAGQLEAATAELEEARGVLTEIYGKLATANGVSDAAPETIADLKAGIETLQSKLTALIPAGGAGQETTDTGIGAKFDASRASAFKSNR